ncbi:MAG: fimbrillin family protein [Alistipes sp.]
MTLRPILFALLLLGATSCTEEFGVDDQPTPTGTMEVVIGGTQASTRTSLDDDGKTICWSNSDKIAVWAKSGSNYLFAAQPFALYTFNSISSSANFSATITPMPQGTYIYYAVYPQPTTVNGTTITCTVPDTQNGAYSGTQDVLVATLTGAALDKRPREELMLNFRHLLHMIRIDIPAGRNLSGEPVKRLEITFPTEVTGSASFDVTAPEQTLIFTGGSRTLTLDFAGAGLTDTQGLCAYAFVRPGTVNGQVSFRAYNAKGIQSKLIATTLNKTMAAGRVTPIALTIPTQREMTLLDFTVATNNLGEELTDIALTAPDGIRFVTPFSATGVATTTATRDANNRFTARLYTDEHPAATIAGKTLGISYESTNALLSNRAIKLPTNLTITQGRATIPMDVPYLFEEDFSGVTGEFGSNDNKGLYDYDADYIADQGIPGWTISRARVNKYALCLRHYVAWSADYFARINSAPLNSIKENHEVKIKVEFNAASSSSKGDISCILGSYDSAIKRNPGTGVDVETPAKTINIAKAPNYADYNKVTLDAPFYQFEVTTAKHTTCMAWKTNANFTGGFTGEYHNAFIDNIKVKIVK